MDGATYWAAEQTALLGTLNATPDGLSAPEASRRLAEAGPNRIDGHEGASALRLLLRQYESPLVLILVFGACISLALREWTDAVIILVIVLLSTLLGFSQELGASAAVKKLRNRLALRVTALRDGRPVAVDAREIVPGDIVLLSAGNLIPADGRLLEARDFLVTEAALTGESFPVEKMPGVVEQEAGLAARTNCVFLGTSVRSGTARMLVVGTGGRTALAGIVHDIARLAPETDFERGIRSFGYLLTRVMMVVVLSVLTVNLLLHRPVVESLLFAVALAVGLTPELLPAIVSVTLSLGARDLATRGVLVRRLAAIENLGGVDILCTDKTGTLTEGRVVLAAASDAAGGESARVLDLAAVNSRLETGIENPLDAAIVAAADKSGRPPAPVTKIDEIPYDFVRKRLTIVVSEGGTGDRHLIVTKGAFDQVLACCDRIVDRNGATTALDAARREAVTALYRDKGGDGFRVLALATREIPARARYSRDDETGMALEGLLLFDDPLKDGIAHTIAGLRALGIATKIISGDNRHVAAHVGRAVGLDGARVVTGSDLTETNTLALRQIVERADIFAEVDPQQKERIVRALQRAGHVVAYMGDGINDAPALHAADVGVSVDQAVDVARESADIVLLERDLEVLRQGILGGRRTFTNTLKYVAITTSANFGNMISMALASVAVPFLPLLAKQILLNNFISDFPCAAISTDNADADRLREPQRWDIGQIQSFMLVFGLVSTVFDMLTFFVLLAVFHAEEAVFQSTWFVVSVLTEIAVALVLRTQLPAWRSRPSRLLLVSSAAVAALAIAIPYAGGLARAFGFTPVPAGLMAIGILIVALYVVATEAVKRYYFSRGR